MITLAGFLERPASGSISQGQIGRESDWLHAAGFELKGPRFLISDAAIMPSEVDGGVVNATAGEYQVFAKLNPTHQQFSLNRGASKK
jgi:hypothetical protein